MSVVVRPLTGDHFVIYCKGSPEKIARLAKKEGGGGGGGLPDNFNRQLEK
jgi:magnesium-transporting ATPase (P-type)